MTDLPILITGADDGFMGYLAAPEYSWQPQLPDDVQNANVSYPSVYSACLAGRCGQVPGSASPRFSCQRSCRRPRMIEGVTRDGPGTDDDQSDLAHGWSRIAAFDDEAIPATAKTKTNG